MGNAHLHCSDITDITKLKRCEMRDDYGGEDTDVGLSGL
jgi:hypothetical protein